MKAINLVVSYKSYVVSGITFTQALEATLGKAKYLPTSMIEKLAEAQAEGYGEKYNCTIFYRLTTSGRYEFFTDEDCTERHEACRKQWQRKIQPYHKEAQAGKRKTVAQIDAVAKEAKSCKAKFSKTEIKRLIKLLSV